MDDDLFYLRDQQPSARLKIAQPGELLVEFVRAPDGAPVRVELRFTGESFGWQSQFLAARRTLTLTVPTSRRGFSP